MPDGAAQSSNEHGYRVGDLRRPQPWRQHGVETTMDSVRRLSLLPALGVLGIALILGRIGSRSDVSAGMSASIDGATAHFDSVIARAGAAGATVDDDEAIGVGYFERLRLGLGSPFRLIDEALHDRRMTDAATQRAVAWALIGRLRRGDAYTIDPVVLDGAGPLRTDGRTARGADHVALIDRAISAAADPRVGELAVRLAYLLAAADGSVNPGTPSAAVRVAALVRDRELAASDLRDLLRDAKNGHADVLDEVRRRRAARTFAVEQPTLGPLPAQLQVMAMNAVPGLVQAIDSLIAPDTSVRWTTSPNASLLSPAIAERVAELGAELPPSAAVVVTMRMHREHTTGFRADAAMAMRDGLIRRSVNEETLVASYARLAQLPDSARRGSAAALLSAAVALRPMAQSQPWFPGDPGPTVADLSEEFGLEGVSFESSVPAAWRPYFLNQIAEALRDEQSVLPGFFQDGLRIAFRLGPLPDSALAMHDPKSRTLELSLWTSGGTLAHELAHDLDWQAARQLFAGSAGYSTDHAMREQRGPLANSMRGLTEARLIRPAGAADPQRGSMRHAELFAQSTDWLVASALARRGRVNGFLSAVQDPLITGYAAGSPTAIGSIGGQALASALGQMTYLPDSVRDGFLAQWAQPSTVDPVLLVRRVLETPVSWRSVWNRPNRFSPPSLAATNGDGLSCLVSGDSPAARARLRLLNRAVETRARGTALRRARYRYGTTPPWAKGLLGAPPWSPAEGHRVIAELRAALAAELATSPADQGVLSSLPAVFRAGTC